MACDIVLPRNPPKVMRGSSPRSMSKKWIEILASHPNNNDNYSSELTPKSAVYLPLVLQRMENEGCVSNYLKQIICWAYDSHSIYAR